MIQQLGENIQEQEIQEERSDHEIETELAILKKQTDDLYRNAAELDYQDKNEEELESLEDEINFA